MRKCASAAGRYLSSSSSLTKTVDMRSAAATTAAAGSSSARVALAARWTASPRPIPGVVRRARSYAATPVLAPPARAAAVRAAAVSFFFFFLERGGKGKAARAMRERSGGPGLPKPRAMACLQRALHVMPGWWRLEGVPGARAAGSKSW